MAISDDVSVVDVEGELVHGFLTRKETTMAS
jgi:hypothetical protein